MAIGKTARDMELHALVIASGHNDHDARAILSSLHAAGYQINPVRADDGVRANRVEAAYDHMLRVEAAAKAILRDKFGDNAHAIWDTPVEATEEHRAEFRACWNIALSNARAALAAADAVADASRDAEARDAARLDWLHTSGCTFDYYMDQSRDFERPIFQVTVMSQFYTASSPRAAIDAAMAAELAPNQNVMPGGAS